jgi:peptidoglycan/LPS O-acetylase OafA/YrhL
MRIASREVGVLGLAASVVVAAGFVYELFAGLHRWQDRVFVVGFLACGGSVMFLVPRMRRRGDRLTMVVFVVTAVILAVMVAINSYSTRGRLATGAIMLVTGVAGAAIVGVREHRARLGRHAPDAGGNAQVVPPP